MKPRHFEYLLVACLFLAGCMVEDTAPAPGPGPSSDTLIDVTEKAYRDEMSAGADFDEQFAKRVRAKEFPSQDPMAKAHLAGLEALRQKRIDTIGKRKDKDVPKTGAVDYEKAAKSYEDMAAGRRRILK